MSFVNGISRLTGSNTGQSVGLPSTGQSQPRAGEATASSALNARFDTVFHSTLSSVLADANQGKYDDPNLSLQIAAAQQRLKAFADQQSSPSASSSAGSTPGASVSGGGPAASPPTSASQGAAAAPDMSATTSVQPGAAADDQRVLLDLQARQAESRLSSVSASLKARYPKAAQLPSASTGLLDPASFTPTSKAEAEAFAQRTAIDVTEAAARLEVVGSQLELARFDAQHDGTATAQAKVAELETLYARQQKYVLGLADVVDRLSGGSLSAAGGSERDHTRTGGMSVAGLQKIAREFGAADSDIAQITGAGDIVEEEATTGHSQTLDTVTAKMTQTLVSWWFEQDRKRSERRSDELNDAAERKRLDAKLEARRDEQNRLHEQQSAASAEAKKNAEQANFSQFLQSIEQARAQIEAAGAARRRQAS